jgi:hypothetical protein
MLCDEISRRNVDRLGFATREPRRFAMSERGGVNETIIATEKP